MQQLEHEQQQPIVSQQHKRQKKVKNFKQYLVQSGCVLHLIKFLLGVRKKQKSDDSVPSDDVLKMFYEYIGAVQVDTKEHDQLKNSAQELKKDNQNMKKEIQSIKKQIKQKKIEKQKALEQKKLKQQEQLAKNAKKGGKK